MPPHLRNRSISNHSPDQVPPRSGSTSARPASSKSPPSKTKKASSSQARISRRPKRVASQQQSPALSTHSANPQNQDEVEENSTWSPAIGAVLEQPPAKMPQILLCAGLLFISVLGTWSWFGKFDQIGNAAGRLIPQGELYKVHSAEAGKIISLTVEEGERVDEGDLIAVLDNELAKGEVERLQQVIRNTESQLVQQQQLLEQLQREVASRRHIADAEVQAQRIAINQATLEVQTSLNLLTQSQQDLLGYQERLSRLEPLVREGAIARERLFQVEQEMRDRRSNVIRNQGTVMTAHTEVEQLHALLSQRVAEGERSALESQQRIQNLLLQITELQGRLQENEMLFRGAQSRLQQYFLYAPVSGVVSSLNIKNPGEVIQPGQTLLEMRSGDDPLVLEAALTSRDAGFVEVGMPVKVKFDAYPYQKFGVIPGEVLFTSPDSEVDPQLGIIYRIKIKLDRHHIISEGEKIEFQAGQTATADIIIRRRRIIDVILEPVQQLRESGVSFGEESDVDASDSNSESSPPSNSSQGES